MKKQSLVLLLFIAFSGFVSAQTPAVSAPLIESDPKNQQTPRVIDPPPAKGTKPASGTGKTSGNPNRSNSPSTQQPAHAPVQPPPVQPSADLTGTWLHPGGQKIEFFQDGQKVYWMHLGANFKQFMVGQFVSANRITGTVIRIDLNNNCRTTLTNTYTLSGNTLTETWTANDGSCDLRAGQTGNEGTLTRTDPCPRPMNPFGGNAYNPSADVTGSWGDESDWFQDGNNVWLILNNGGFKHLFQGTRSGRTINGAIVRINRGNNCRTVMNLSVSLTDANHYRFTSSVEDGLCDLPRGWSESRSVARSWPQFYDGISSQRYRIKNKNRGLYLAVRGGTLNSGEEATLWHLDGGEDKIWEPIYVGCGYYKIKNHKSGLCLAVGAGVANDGGRIVQYQDHGQADILWRMVDIGNGCYKIQNKNSNLFAAIGAGETTPGAHVIQWSDAGQEDTKWVFEVFIP
ncbi:MAG: RICIN domain-containing protein [Saprospiraceae bacterium]